MAVNKTIRAELLDNVVNTYDQTKTTIIGRVTQKVISGVNVLGPVQNKFIDVFSDFGIAPGLFFISPNNRLFVAASAPINGTTYDTLPIMLYDFNLNTGAHLPIGRIDIQLPNVAATVHTIRDIKVHNDATNTGWRIFVTTTASVLINGGLFCANNIDKSDFSMSSPPVIPMATSSNAKAVYFLQDPSAIGVNHLNTASVGAFMDTSNNRIYVHNGTAALHQYYAFNMDAPTYTTSSVSVSVGLPGIVTHTGHSFSNNDPVIFTAGTLPSPLTVGTVYFVRNPTANTYELSATSGGPSINTTGSPSVGAEIGRAWGTTSSNFVFRTGNLPALTGTLLANGSEYYATPQHTANSGFPCAFFGTTTTMYLGRLSDLGPSVTTWPSLLSANYSGAANEIITQTASFVGFSNTMDKSFVAVPASRFLIKPVVNNTLDRRFGTVNISVLEATSPEVVDFGAVTIIAMNTRNGWIGLCSSTIGQRGVFLIDASADALFGTAYIVTKVLDVKHLNIQALTFLRQHSNFSVGPKIQYRTSGFTSLTGGWTDIDSLEDITLAPSDQIQFKILFNVLNGSSNIPQQINELFVTGQSVFAMSEHWEFSDDFSDNTSPSRTAFRLKKAYPTSVPQLFYRAYDLSDVLLVNHNTVTHAANFQYSTDNGITWLPLGTIPNVVGTLVRYTFTTPPGVDIRPSLRES